ncbi:hypothetical protein SCP_0801060 [Sparassis crispa]|uniref:Uncharacterized protein n=1 Tax=Sparassis crispa TaxID=139825 RepID=A0A401GTS7_9APHY|nr:hypothetical protein SCP_0801060 [Sparassis crispa]GBE85589.1 hypothetical protein SCP_0801060 [Sparassis crispa]
MEHSKEDGTLPPIAPQLLVDMHISRAEEAFMEIDEQVTEEWRLENEIPNTDVIEETREGLAQKRNRAPSTVVKQPRRKAARRSSARGPPLHFFGLRSIISRLVAPCPWYHDTSETSHRPHRRILCINRLAGPHIVHPVLEELALAPFGASLDHLELDMRCHNAFDPQQLCLAHSTELHTLCLCSQSYSLSEGNLEQTLPAILSQISPKSRLRRLELTVKVTDIDWKRVDEILAQDHFIQLEMVTLRYWWSAVTREDIDWWERELSERMSRSLSRLHLRGAVVEMLPIHGEVNMLVNRDID